MANHRTTLPPGLTTLLLTLICLLVLPSEGFADELAIPSNFSPAEAATAEALQQVIPVLEAFEARTGSYPGPTRGVVPLSTFRELFPGLALVDGWGQPFLVWSNGNGMALVITGPDGKPARDYRRWDPSTEVSGDDEVLILGQVGDSASPVAPAVAARQRFRAIAEMRALGTVLEALPATEKRLIDTKGKVLPVERIKAQLVPAYLTSLTSADPWGRPYLYWSDGNDYRLLSYGQDGQPDSAAAFGKLRGGRADAAPERDIVFAAGTFVYSD